MTDYNSTTEYFMASDAEELVTEALNEFDEYMVHIGGCTDGNCIIVRPRGMHTNGGCKCSSNYIKMQQFAQATRRLYAKIASLKIEG